MNLNNTLDEDYKVLKAHYLNFMPWFNATDENGNNMEGLVGVLMDYVKKSMNLRFELMTSNEAPIIGEKLDDGNWTGVAGLINRNETQISLLAIILKDGELDGARATFPLWFTTLTILSGLPPGFNDEFFNLLIPFDKESEVCLIITVITLTLLSFGLERVMVGVLPDPRKIRKITFLEHCSLFVKPTAYQPVTNSSTIPRSSAAKICFIMWWLTMLVMANLFSSQLKANSSAFQTPFRFDYLEDIVEFPDIRVIMFREPSMVGFFKKSPRALDRAVFQQIERTLGLVDLEEYLIESNMEATRLGKSIIIGELYTLAEKFKEECLTNDSYQMGKGRFGSLPISLIVSKALGERFLEELNNKIIRFYETANARHFMDTSHVPLINCLGRTQPDKTTDTTFTTTELKPFLIFLSIALTVSTSVFIIELCTSVCRVSTKKNRRRRGPVIVLKHERD